MGKYKNCYLRISLTLYNTHVEPKHKLFMFGYNDKKWRSALLRIDRGSWHVFGGGYGLILVLMSVVP